MKKLMTIALGAVLALTMVSCGGEKKAAKKNMNSAA